VPKILASRVADLQKSRTPYVHARVVLAEKPTSAKPGDEALIFSDGTIEGFVGGSCAESTVRTQGMSVLGDGHALLLRIAPMPEPDTQSGKRTVHNPCLSGGTLEIFLEPVMPAPLVAIFGDSPISGSLIKQGPGAGYEMVEWDNSIDLANTFALIVAAHGRDDETMLLEAAVTAGVPYVGLVASRKRGTAVIEMLNLTADQKASIHSPAGLDIGARTPDHIALSILAEMVQAGANSAEPRKPAPVCDTAIDPVCNMSVPMVKESIHAEFGDNTVWFCAPGCLKAYSANPESFQLV
jgi:xanthine dehydrogenase accessory factor